MGDVSILMHTLDVFDDSIRFYVMMVVIVIAQWHTASIERCLSLSMSRVFLIGARHVHGVV